MAESLVAYLHHLSIILTGGFLIGELIVCRPGVTREQLRRLPIVDVVFFASALMALATGSAPSVLLLQGRRLLRRQSVLLGEDGPLRDHRHALDQADAHLHPLETLERRGRHGSHRRRDRRRAA